jgi:RNA polymerase sigma factor (sigma-70 family)
MDLEANRSLIAAALARIPAGDRAALQTVYRLTSAKLFGVALRILGERSEAEDVLQEVYVTVWRKAADFDADRASPMTWLIAIARNRAIDRLRASRQSRRAEPIEAASYLADAAPGAEAALASAQEHARLRVRLRFNKFSDQRPS